ncbi:MAG TPA: NAD(P)-dependent alcohol dehydrogenase [Thermoanaerobaculales bacterium]|nr:NAD(P)-dependent alcohol dehydrogenase [Thermoanaerobaculales bacterium]
MKAITQDRYGSADVLRLTDVAMPPVGERDVLIRVRAAGVDPGVWHLMTGLPYVVRIMGYGLRAPRTRVRGYDVAGTVEAVGGNVTRFRPGDPVFGMCDGSFAEHACARERNLGPKPANLTFVQAAAVPVSGLTALQGLRDHGRVEAGQGVLVTGAGGGVGTFAVQLAKAFGAEVTGACSAPKVDLVRSIGADHVVDSTHDDLTQARHRYDLILDTAGARPLSQLRRVLADRGTLVIVGAEGGDRWIGGIDRQLRAVLLSAFVRHTLRMFIARCRAEDLRLLAELIEAGKVRPVIDQVFPLSAAADAVRYLAEGRARGKVVIEV